MNDLWKKHSKFNSIQKYSPKVKLELHNLQAETNQVFHKADLPIFIYNHILHREKTSSIHSNGDFA